MNLNLHDKRKDELVHTIWNITVVAVAALISSYVIISLLRYVVKLVL